MITIRLEKLTSQEQMCLRYASVIGNQFEEKMLAAILPSKQKHMSAKSLSLLLQVLVEKGFIICVEENSIWGETMYEFQNSLIESTVYKMIPTT